MKVSSLLQTRHSETLALIKASVQSCSLPGQVWVMETVNQPHSTALFVYSAFPPCQAIKLLDQSGAGPKSKLPPT